MARVVPIELAVPVETERGNTGIISSKLDTLGEQPLLFFQSWHCDDT
jgi:hypothetical protein